MADTSAPSRPPADDPPAWDAVDRYLAGESDVVERDAIVRWLRNAGETGVVLSHLRSGYRFRSAAADAVDAVERANRIVGAVSARTLGKTRQGGWQEGLGRRTLRGSQGRQTLFKGLASFMHRPLITAALVGAVILLIGRSVFRDRGTVKGHVVHTYRTRVGEIATVRWGNGSTMMLAPATTVTVSAASVDVMGEAYFTVTAHPKNPLTVITRGAVVRVLGTRFAVRQYPDELRSGVVVEDGRVSLRARGRGDVSHSGIVLSARMHAEVSDSGVSVQEGVAPDDYTGWTHGELRFTRTPLCDVVKTLSRVYGVHIRIADSALANEVVSADVKVQRPLAQVLNAIGVILNAHVVHDNGMFTLMTGRSARDMPHSTSERLFHHFQQPERQYGR